MNSMSMDHTQQQSHEELAKAKDLSLQSTRPPVELPGFDTQRLLGRGAFGEVWTAIDKNTGRQVAIKFYTQRSRLDWTLLAREVEKLVFLSADRYVVQLLEVGWESDPPYYVMEYVEEGSLDDLLRGHGPLPVNDAVELFREIATGLVHAHGKGVLHCDLKPANILLDQDHRPRLADFGQSRLSNEQSPALGTLFFMAPEQADLTAVPDVRWDVYALGAILYCMLTGSPPYRDDAMIQELDTANDLVGRLAAYRRNIKDSPQPQEHRKASGVDRSLAEIVDRCLAVDSGRRYANVQEVLDALQVRDESRVRNPLVFLGFIGPVLLLGIMALFGLRGYERAVSDSEDFISQRARESNEFAAKFAARSIEGEIARYFRLVQREASFPELCEKLEAAADLPITHELNVRNRQGQDIDELREQFVGQSERLEFNRYLEERLAYYLERFKNDDRELKVASMLAVDDQGRMLAVAYDHSKPSKSIGWNYAHRTYFFGGPADMEFPNRDPKFMQMPEETEPIRETHFSAAFRSTTTGLWKVAVSTPVFEDGDPNGRVIGVLALTVNLGDFAYFRSRTYQDRFAVLVDGRSGPNRGVILQHPFFDIEQRQGKAPSESYSTSEYRISEQQLEELRSDSLNRYYDPLAAAPGGAVYAGAWIAAMSNVPLPSASPDSEDVIVLIQERYADATAPVKSLADRLKKEGLWALGGVIAVILVLWYIVLRMLSEPRMLRRAQPVGSALPTANVPLSTLDKPS